MMERTLISIITSVYNINNELLSTLIDLTSVQHGDNFGKIRAISRSSHQRYKKSANVVHKRGRFIY